jgi:hypothetical protein
MGVECATPAEGVPFLVDGDPIQITGRIDRIDYHAETGRWALFDYKTGAKGEAPEKTHRAGRGDDRRWTDLQLPLYRHLLPHVRDADGEPPYPPGSGGEILLGYLLLPQQLDCVGESLAAWTAEELESADECAREVVRVLRTSEFTFDPARVAAYRNTPFATIVGLGYLEGAADPGEESE